MDVNFLAQESASHTFIGQRVSKTQDNPYGFWLVNHIPVDEPAILALTGSGTRERFGTDNQAGYKSANGYLSDIEKFLQKGNITQKVGLYAVVYNFGSSEHGEEKFNDRLARKKLFADHHVPTYDLCLYRQHNPKFVGNKYLWQNAKGQTIEQTLDEETLSPTYVDELFE